MSQPSRSILKMIFSNFINSLKPRSYRGDLIGKDHLGNKYFQIVADGTQKKQRWFEPKEKENFDQEIPAEWESWLRYRRQVPPTEEEVLNNAAIAKQKKTNAASLEANRTVAVDPKQNQLTGTSFPTYEEYEIFPGAKNKGKTDE